jgi:hypothetical protein
MATNCQATEMPDKQCLKHAYDVLATAVNACESDKTCIDAAQGAFRAAVANCIPTHKK